MSASTARERETYRIHRRDLSSKRFTGGLTGQQHSRTDHDHARHPALHPPHCADPPSVLRECGLVGNVAAVRMGDDDDFSLLAFDQARKLGLDDDRVVLHRDVPRALVGEQQGQDDFVPIAL